LRWQSHRKGIQKRLLPYFDPEFKFGGSATEITITLKNPYISGKLELFGHYDAAT
jgi:hypothetical protein